MVHIGTSAQKYCTDINGWKLRDFYASFSHSLQRFSSVQFSHSVVPNSLRPHESQHARPLCPSPTPGVYSNRCPSSCDAIKPPHPLSSPTIGPNPSQHWGLFQ